MESGTRDVSTAAAVIADVTGATAETEHAALFAHLVDLCEPMLTATAPDAPRLAIALREVARVYVGLVRENSELKDGLADAEKEVEVQAATFEIARVRHQETTAELDGVRDAARAAEAAWQQDRAALIALWESERAEAAARLARMNMEKAASSDDAARATAVAASMMIQHAEAREELKARLKPLEDDFRAIRLRAVATALDELQVMQACGLTYSQLRESGVFRKGSAKRLRELASSLASLAAGSPPPLLVQCAAIALAAGLDSKAARDVAAAAMPLLGGATSDDDVLAAAKKDADARVAALPPAAAASTRALGAARALVLSASSPQFDAATKAFRTAVSKGHTVAVRVGNAVAHPSHADLAAMPLESYARDIDAIRFAHERTQLQEMVHEFRQMCTAVYGPAGVATATAGPVAFIGSDSDTSDQGSDNGSDGGADAGGAGAMPAIVATGGAGTGSACPVCGKT